MTGLLHEKEFSRRAFLKGGGALIVGFSALTGNAQAADGPFASNGGMPDTWISSQYMQAGPASAAHPHG